LHLCGQQLTARNVTAVVIPVAPSAVSNAAHVVSAQNAQSALKVKQPKGSAVTVVAATHAVAVAVSVLQSARLNAVTSHVQIRATSLVLNLVTTPALRVVQKVVARVQMAVTSAMNLASTLKALKTLRIT
jgi:hypothetical protein